MSETIRSTTQRVQSIMQREPATRDDDKLLTLRVCEDIARENGIWLHFPRELLPLIPAFATVKRVRAWIQNDHKELKPLKAETEAARHRHENEVRWWATKE